MINLYLMYEFSDGYEVIAQAYSAEELAAEEEEHGPFKRMSVPSSEDLTRFFREKEPEKGADCDANAKEPAAVVDVEEAEEAEFESGELSGAIIDKLAELRAARYYYRQRGDVLSKHIVQLMRRQSLTTYSSDKYTAKLTKRGISLTRINDDLLQEVLRDV